MSRINLVQSRSRRAEIINFTGSSSRAFDRKALYCLLLVMIVTGMLCLPFFRVVWWLGDEGILLRGATELLAGKKIYNDFFAFYPPGGYLIMAGWMKLFGSSFIAIRCFSVLVIVGIAGFSYLTILSVSGSVVLALFLALSWISTAESTFLLPVSHHWITTLLSMVAFWLTCASLRGDRRGTALSFVVGLIAGAASMVTSSRGVLTIFAALASYVGARNCRYARMSCLAAVFVVPVVCLIYIIVNGEFVQAFDQIVVFTLTQYSNVTKVPFGYGIRWFYPNLYLFPIAGVLAVVALASRFRQTVSDAQFRTCVFYGLAGFVGAFPRPDAAHIFFTEPLALPLVGYCASRMTFGWRQKYRGIAFAFAGLWCLPPAVGFIHEGITVSSAPVIATANGDIALLRYQENGGRQMFQFLAGTNPSDKFFFYPYLPMVPYLAKREQTSRYDIFIPGYTTKAQYYEACTDVVQNAKWVVLDTKLMEPKSWKQIFPAMKNPSPPETQAFERALQQNFQFVHRFGVFEIRQRAGVANMAACQQILK